MSFLERKAIRQIIYKKYRNLDNGEFFFNKFFHYHINKTDDPDVCEKMGHMISQITNQSIN